MKKIIILFLHLVFMGLVGCKQGAGTGSSEVNYFMPFHDIYIGFFDPYGMKAPINYVLVYKKGETTGSRPTYWIPGNEITRKRGYLRIRLPENTYDIIVSSNNGQEVTFQSVEINGQQDGYVIKKVMPTVTTPAGELFDKKGSYWVSGSNTEFTVNVRAIFLDLDREISGGFKNAFAYALYVDRNGDTTYTQHRMRRDEEGIMCSCEIEYQNANPPRAIRFRSGVSTHPIEIGAGESENDMIFPFNREAQFDKVVIAHPKPGSDRDWDFTKIPQSRLVPIRDSLDIPETWREIYNFSHPPRVYNEDK